jgi:hypothetical protein
LPVSAHPHLTGHESAGFAVLDPEELVDDFAFLVVMNLGLRSLIKLGKCPGLCRIQARNLGAKGGDFCLQLRIGKLLGSSEIIEKSLTDLVFACLRI